MIRKESNDGTGKTSEFAYDVCISFAGEDRECARKIAETFRNRKIRVFFDEYERSQLWGKDLYTHLDSIYRTSARFCVMLLSRHYARKLWTNLERQSAQARAFSENEEYILPVRLDDTEIPGIRPTVGYIDLRAIAVEDLASLLASKLGDRSDRLSAALGDLKPTAALPVLLDMLKANDIDARLRGVQELAGLGSSAIEAVPDLVAALADAEPIPTEVIRALAAIDLEKRATVRSLVGVLSGHSEPLQTIAAAQLVKIGPFALEYILQLLENRSEQVRERAEFVLQGIGPKAAHEVVRTAISSRSQPARETALRILSKLDAESLGIDAPVLVRGLASESVETCETILNILALIVHEAPWVGALRDTFRAGNGLRKLPEKQTYSFYGPGDDPYIVTISCPELVALKRLKESGISALLDVIELGNALSGSFEIHLSTQAREAVQSMGPAAEGLLQLLVKTSDKELREQAKWGLWAFSSDRYPLKL